jgi:ATP-binding cassette subfamily C protein
MAAWVFHLGCGSRGKTSQIKHMSTPSIYSAIQKLKSLLTKEQKLRWLGIAGFALCTSFLEIVTASIIVIFAQVLNAPELGQKYLSKFGFSDSLAPGRIVLIVAIACGVIYFIKNCIAAIEVFYQNFSIQKMNYDFKNKLLNRYAQTDYAFYLTRNSALGIQVVSGDAELAFSRGMIAVANILSEGIVFSCLVSMIVYMNPSLTLTIIGIGSICILTITKGLLPFFYRWGQKLQEENVCAGQSLMQFFHAFKEIVLLGKRDAFVESYKNHSYKKYKIHARHNATNALPRIIIEVLFVLLFVTTVACMCAQNETSSQMLGMLGGYLYVGFRVMPGLNRIITQLNDFKSAIPSIERVYDEYNTVAAKDIYQNITEFSFEKNIVLKDVSFRYPNTEKDTVSNINLEIKKGERIGFVGETGAGKSTLVDIILGLLKVNQGNILIDGKYLPHCIQWHEKIGYVPQAIYLTDDTIEANIAFGEKKENIVSSRIEAVIEDAQLRKFIDALPMKSNTVIGERGVRLSGGERQRIAIARALYRDPEVLIFDEATSALDNETEQKLMETIHAISQNRTVIMIAHRWTTLKDCDYVFIVKKGQPLQKMRYQDFLERKNLALSDITEVTN